MNTHTPETSKDQVALTGHVKFYDSKKGFGFIEVAGDKDHYFNRDCIKTGAPVQGDAVAFVSVAHNKGPQAREVLVLKTPASNQKFAGDRPDSNHWVNDAGSVKRPVNGRIECDGCNSMVVPRVVTRDGRPRRSFCPHCGNQIQNFGISRKRLIGYAVKIVALIAFGAVYLGYFGK